MKTQNLFFLFLLITGLTLFSTNVAFCQDQASKLFEKALYLEESQGDLQSAISLYDKIVKEFENQQEISAKAQLHIGLCYEKLGNSEAIKAYELVVEKYSNQKEEVATAKSRLDELKKEPPKGFTVINLGGWDKPGMTFQAYEIYPDKNLGVGVEFLKGQNIIMYNLETDEVNFITEYTWDGNGFTWTYHPLLSPDGKEIVYFSQFVNTGVESLNNLIITSLNGQSSTIASDTSIWYIPNAWTPDSKGILCIKGGSDVAPQLGIISKDGSTFKVLATLMEKNQQLGKTYPTASLSPDGRYVLFTDNAPGEKSDIYIVGMDGTEEILFKNPAEDNYPRWSPDGKNFIFLSKRHGSRALWGADFQDGKVKGDPYLIRDGMKDSYLLNWSKEGLAAWEWIRTSDIYNVDIDPKTYQPINKPTQIDYVPTGYNGVPVWSHDGKQYAFISANPSGGNITIVVIGKDTKEYPVPKEYAYNYPRWSPDDSMIGMVAKDPKGVWNFYRLVIKTNEWEVTPISVESFAMFEWCGDGKSILLSNGGTRDLGAGIYRLDLATGEKQYKYQPTDTSLVMYMMLNCSRDYKQVAFLENRMKVMVADLETGESALAADSLGFPSWLPDGQHVLTDGYFTSESHQSIFVVPAEGGSATEINLSQYFPKESRISFPNWSPENKVLFALNSQKSEILLYKNIIESVKQK